MAGVEARLLSVAGADGCDIALDDDAGRCFPWDWARIPVVRDLRCSSGLARALHELAPKADVIYDHGLWLMPNVDAGRAALLARKPFIVAPRGMLAPAALAFSRMKKRVIWALLQGEVVRRAACIHATSEQEHDEIRDFGLNNPVAIVPNGIDLPEPRVCSISVHSRWPDCPVTGTHPSEKGIGPSGARLGNGGSGSSRLAAANRRAGRTRSRWRTRRPGSGVKARRVSIEKSVAGDAKITAYQPGRSLCFRPSTRTSPSRWRKRWRLEHRSSPQRVRHGMAGG